MVELYLRLLERVLAPVLLVISVLLMARGHDLPGGGFIGGLLAAAAFALLILARGADAVRRAVGRWPARLPGIGLLIALSAALLPMATGRPFFQSLWVTLHLGSFTLKLGTPVAFDFGVFLAVLGVAVAFLLGLSHGVVEAPGKEQP